MTRDQSLIQSMSWFRASVGAGLVAVAGCGQAPPPPPPATVVSRAPVEQTEFCLPDVKGAVAIPSKERAEQLGCLLDEDIMKADFSKQSVGLFRRTVNCNGTAKLEDGVVYWTDFGVCGADSQTKLDFVAFFDKSAGFVDKEVGFETRPEGRVLAMQRLGEYTRDDTELLHFRRAMDPKVMTWTLKEGDKTSTWTRSADDLTLEDIKQTLLYRRVITDFECPQPPANNRFVCTAKGVDFKGTYTVTVKKKRFQLHALDEEVLGL